MALILGLLVAGCARDMEFTMIAPRPPAEYEVLGSAEGRACASAVLILPFLDRPLISGYPERLRRALGNALEDVPGATALVNVEVRQTKAWWLLGITDCVTLRGDAIR